MSLTFEINYFDVPDYSVSDLLVVGTKQNQGYFYQYNKTGTETWDLVDTYTATSTN